MTSTLPPPLSEDDDLMAAEYVMGVTDLAARAEAEARIKRDPAFAAAVEAWEIRLEGLNDDFAEAPAPNLMPAIEARLFPTQAEPRKGWFGWATGGALAAMVALALFLFLPTTPVAPVLTTLAAADLAYEVRSDGTTLQVTRTLGTPAPAGQVHELWVIAPGAAPVSLGLLADATLEIPYPTPPAGWTLAVSVEPTGGSTTGAPTGPVILAQEIGA
ncbi:MAG: anti-sigma factor [Paracoccaceae bacterium]